MKTKRVTSKEESSTATQGSKSTAIVPGNTSALGKRAADVLASGDLSAFGEPKPDSRTLIEIRESAERLALELDDFLTKHEVPTKGLLKRKDEGAEGPKRRENREERDKERSQGEICKRQPEILIYLK